MIPEEIRRRLGLEPGTRFIVMAEDDSVVLTTIQPPSMEEFDSLLSRARSAAREAGLRSSDIAAAIDRARSER